MCFENGILHQADHGEIRGLPIAADRYANPGTNDSVGRWTLTSFR